jgi:hypothetical protein
VSISELGEQRHAAKCAGMIKEWLHADYNVWPDRHACKTHATEDRSVCLLVLLTSEVWQQWWHLSARRTELAAIGKRTVHTDFKFWCMQEAWGDHRELGLPFVAVHLPMSFLRNLKLSKQPGIDSGKETICAGMDRVVTLPP